MSYESEFMKFRPQVRTMCGIAEGTTSLDLAGRGLDPACTRLLAAELRARRTTAALQLPGWGWCVHANNKVSGTKPGYDAAPCRIAGFSAHYRDLCI